MINRRFTRRQFISHAGTFGLASISALSAYASFIEPTLYEITEVNIEIPDLPEKFEGFRITQLSDIHHSRIVPIEEIRRVVQLAVSTKPDLIALTGDYTTARRKYIEPCAEALKELNAPEGVWAVLGNHDHFTSAELTARALARANINVLDNESTNLRRGPDTLQLAGIDDWSWNATDWNKVLKGNVSKYPSVLLSHQPSILKLPESQNFSLVLSGHLHGGQIQLPFIGPPARFLGKNFQYIDGLYQVNQTKLYVSRGTGVIGLPVRFGTRPEITVLTLCRKRP
jgi:uncharacterized protein